MSDAIKSQLSAAIGARKDSLIALRARIVDLLEDVPVGVKLSDDSGLVVKVVPVYTGASQWANRTWDVAITGWGLIDADGRLIAECLSDSQWDGRNMHFRSTERTMLGVPPFDIDCDECAKVLQFAPGTVTREIALRLPEAISRYMGECEAERAKNEATLA